MRGDFDPVRPMARDIQLLDRPPTLPSPSPRDEAPAPDGPRPEAPVFEDLLPTFERLRERLQSLEAELAQERQRQQEHRRLGNEARARVDQLLGEREQLENRRDELEKLLREAREDIAGAQGENRRLGRENEDLKRRHQALLESTSWRLTAPIRALLDRLRRRSA
jgi:chromosome segregation ATPase